MLYFFLHTSYSSLYSVKCQLFSRTDKESCEHTQVGGLNCLWLVQKCSNAIASRALQCIKSDMLD